MIAHQVTLRRSGCWASGNGSHVCGSAFRDDELFGSDALCGYLAAPPDFEAFVAKIEKLNGFFAAIVEAGPETLYAAVDPLRSIPLFYACDATRQRRCLFSDDANWLDGRLGPQRAPAETATEFLLAGYVTGADTLRPAIKQLQAGEALKAHVGTDGRMVIDRRRYFEFVPREQIGDESVLQEQLDLEMKAAVNRLIRFAGGRQIVVPLSGGNDSRLILLTLRRLGYDKLLAFTYGRPGNRESVISERVAARLGVAWRFVPYDNTMWAAWWHSDVRKRYFALSHQFVSIPHFQDHPAVGVLQRERAIEDSAVFAPGYSGDFVAGSHIPRRLVDADHVCRGDFLDVMHETHHCLWNRREQPLEHTAAIDAKLLHQMGHGIEDPNHAIVAYEKWDFEERQAKFIVNAVRVYEDFGYDWWLPFFDRKYIDFWLKVPLRLRVNKLLYDKYVASVYANYCRVSLQEARETTAQSLAQRMRRVVMHFTLFLPIARALFDKIKRTREYDAHHLAIYGIVDREHFTKLYTGRQNVNSFVARFIILEERDV